MNSFTCIKPNCGKVYQTEDDEAYYCGDCLTERQKIARDIDAKMAGRSSMQPRTELQMYEDALSRGVSKGGMRFVNAKDLGLL